MLRLFLCFFISLAAIITADDPTREEKYIKETIANFYSAWNEHDSKKMVDNFAVDGDYRSAQGDVATGKMAIEKKFEQMHTTTAKNAHTNPAITSIRMVNPNIAFVDVEASVEGMTSEDGNKYRPAKHHIVFLIIKRDGLWEILDYRPF